MATSVTPASTMTANSACRSGASGVVNALGSALAGLPGTCTRVRTVPSRPVARPAAVRPVSSRCATVVLPEVPVTPSTRSRAVGSP